jgi:hypothetical protein
LAENKPATQTEASKLPIPVPVIVAAVVVALAVGAWAVLDYVARKNPPARQVLTTEAKQYVHTLQLSNVEIKAAESYMKQQVVEITGTIADNGPRVVKVVEIYCVFRDAYGQVVLRERVSIVGARTGPLAPGGRKNFRLAFDNIPESWNQAIPDLVIAGIVFG